MYIVVHITNTQTDSDANKAKINITIWGENIEDNTKCHKTT